MRYSGVLLVGLLCAQNILSMGARLGFYRSQFLSPTDRNSTLTTLSPTYRSGITGFLSWGWSEYFATGLEIGYQGVGQKFYGVGFRGESYTSEVSLNYLRLGVGFQPQYAQDSWGIWASLAPGLSLLTRSDLNFSGDTLAQGTLIMPQIARRVLNYLEKSTNPEDRLLPVRMYRRVVPTLSVSGGLRVRLAPTVWVLGLFYYERSFGDMEKKGYKIPGDESPLYSRERKPVRYQLTGIQVGLQYEVSIRP
ncbi:MAG: hypothetical protein NZZ60_00920 [Bacteroidia bacterium]|nr:hypothetical protein [Bacteroidia bacterium]MCX7651286.1 hypothetical protein [Bacteroidia bacterium]MDW8416234.1 hypothetical protein [Bacteroidia bacterium]